MKRHLFRAAALAILAALAAPSPASAQPGGAGGNPPTVSPYLNLLRRNTSPALNYYGLVRPEQQLRQSVQGVQSIASANQASINELYSGGGLAQTGVPAQFMNYGSFFFTQNGGGGGRGGAASFGTNRTGGGTGGRR